MKNIETLLLSGYSVFYRTKETGDESKNLKKHPLVQCVASKEGSRQLKSSFVRAEKPCDSIKDATKQVVNLLKKIEKGTKK